MNNFIFQNDSDHEADTDVNRKIIKAEEVKHYEQYIVANKQQSFEQSTH